MIIVGVVPEDRRNEVEEKENKRIVSDLRQDIGTCQTRRSPIGLNGIQHYFKDFGSEMSFGRFCLVLRDKKIKNKRCIKVSSEYWDLSNQHLGVTKNSTLFQEFVSQISLQTLFSCRDKKRKKKEKKTKQDKKRLLESDVMVRISKYYVPCLGKLCKKSYFRLRLKALCIHSNGKELLAMTDFRL
ncbi:hypothetical protein M0804_012531 [Polistes exclamans]|nr:hypothetical protein M0804_012531 [Polistes exclamans]